MRVQRWLIPLWMEELDHLDDEPKQAAGGFLGGSWEAFAAQMSRQ